MLKQGSTLSPRSLNVVMLIGGILTMVSLAVNSHDEIFSPTSLVYSVFEQFINTKMKTILPEAQIYHLDHLIKLVYVSSDFLFDD